jgi:hypothetical protein
MGFGDDKATGDRNCPIEPFGGVMAAAELRTTAHKLGRSDFRALERQVHVLDTMHGRLRSKLFVLPGSDLRCLANPR